MRVRCSRSAPLATDQLPNRGVHSSDPTHRASRIPGWLHGSSRLFERTIAHRREPIGQARDKAALLGAPRRREERASGKSLRPREGLKTRAALCPGLNPRAHRQKAAGVPSSWPRQSLGLSSNRLPREIRKADTLLCDQATSFRRALQRRPCPVRRDSLAVAAAEHKAPTDGFRVSQAPRRVRTPRSGPTRDSHPRFSLTSDAFRSDGRQGQSLGRTASSNREVVSTTEADGVSIGNMRSRARYERFSFPAGRSSLPCAGTEGLPPAWEGSERAGGGATLFGVCR